MNTQTKANELANDIAAAQQALGEDASRVGNPMWSAWHDLDTIREAVERVAEDGECMLDWAQGLVQRTLDNSKHEIDSAERFLEL
jgi:hypothetical protein